MRLINKNKILPDDVNFVNVWHWLFTSKTRNQWLSDDYFSRKEDLSIPLLEVYMRKSQRIVNRQIIVCIDVAAITIDEKYQKQGYFTKFINELKRYEYPIIIESVGNKSLFNCLLNNTRNLDFKIFGEIANKTFIWIPEVKK